MTRTDRRDARLLLSGLTLFLVLMLAFPLAADLYYSVSEVSFQTLRSPTLTGFGNYAATLADPAFWQAAGFSLRFALASTAVEVLLGLGLAVALEPLIRRRSWLMAFLLLPMMISPALLGIMYRLMLNEFVGLVPQYLALLGFRQDLLGPDWVVFTLVLIEVLQWTPFAFLILLAAYQAIPTDLVEAARIDGAGAWTVFRRIELPLLGPALAITAFIRFIDGFRVFDHIYVLTNGGPGNATTSLSIYIYKAFFQQEALGQAIAASVILLLVSLALLYASLRFILRESGGR